MRRSQRSPRETRSKTTIWFQIWFVSYLLLKSRNWKFEWWDRNDCWRKRNDIDTTAHKEECMKGWMLVDSWQTSTQLIYLCQLVIGKWAWNIVVCATLSHGSPAWIVAALIGGWNKWHRALSLAKSGLMVHKGWLVLVETSGKPNLPVPSSYQKREKFLVTKQRCVSVGSQKESFSTNENSGCKLLDQSECKFTLKHVEKRCFENRADC